MSDQEDLEVAELYRLVLRRLVESSGDAGRLVTPTQLVADGWLEPGGYVSPAGVQPSYLVHALDALVRDQLAERIVPAIGESSYRPTESGRQRLRDFD